MPAVQNSAYMLCAHSSSLRAQIRGALVIPLWLFIPDHSPWSPTDFYFFMAGQPLGFPVTRWSTYT